ncbi:MAG: hypothetical protein D6798_08050, partial [Deltaproteobacteria bacterium]
MQRLGEAVHGRVAASLVEQAPGLVEILVERVRLGDADVDPPVPDPGTGQGLLDQGGRCCGEQLDGDAPGVQRPGDHELAGEVAEAVRGTHDGGEGAHQGHNTKIITVGDPKQAIYSFRGAD